MSENKRTHRSSEEIRAAKIAALEEKKAFHIRMTDETQKKIDELNNPAPTMTDITRFIRENNLSLEAVQKALRKLAK